MPKKIPYRQVGAKIMVMKLQTELKLMYRGRITDEGNGLKEMIKDCKAELKMIKQTDDIIISRDKLDEIDKSMNGAVVTMNRINACINRTKTIL